MIGKFSKLCPKCRGVNVPAFPPDTLGIPLKRPIVKKHQRGMNNRGNQTESYEAHTCRPEAKHWEIEIRTFRPRMFRPRMIRPTDCSSYSIRTKNVIELFTRSWIDEIIFG